MDFLGITHFGLALLAILAGALAALATKATPTHRWIGRTYFGAMVGVNGTALMIYDLFGGFGPFHWAALFSLATTAIGFAYARLKRPRRKQWMVRHAYWITWSYVGLLAAAVSETSTRLLDLNFGWTVAVASLAVVAAGAIVIARGVPPALARLGAR